MTPDPYTRLTKAQLDVLRLIPTLRDHKLVARHLDLKPDALRERLRDARAILGVSRSWDAAMIVQAREADYTRDVDTSRQVPSPWLTPLPPPPTADVPDEAVTSSTLREERQPFRLSVEPDALPRQRRWRDLFLRKGKDGNNDLSILETLLSITLILAAFGLAAFFITAAIEAYSRHELEVRAARSRPVPASQ